jgi:hypothetical protein
MTTEADSRIVIDRLLREAGWDPEAGPRLRPATRTRHTDGGQAAGKHSRAGFRAKSARRNADKPATRMADKHF